MTPSTAPREALTARASFSLVTGVATLRSPRSASRQPQPLPPLPIPVEGRRQRLKLTQQDGIAAAVDERQEENLFLDIGREVQKVHDLAYPRRADVAQTSQLRLMLDRAAAEPFVEMQGECHPAADAR